MSDELHAPAALLPIKSSRYPLDRRQGGPQNQPGRCGEEKNFLPPPGNEPRPSGHVSCCYTDCAMCSLHKTQKLLAWRNANWCWRKPVNQCLRVQIPEKVVQSIRHTSRNESITVSCHVIGTRQYAPVAGLWTSVCPIGFTRRASLRERTAIKEQREVCKT